MFARLVAFFVALPCLGVGALGAARRFLPDHDAVSSADKLIEGLLRQAGWSSGHAGSALPEAATWGALAVGVVALAFSLRPGGAKPEAVSEESDQPQIDRRVAKKTAKVAAGMAKKGQVEEAADFCFQSGLIDLAADYYEKAERFKRAAELRHDQNRFVEAAELYVRAGDHETAGTVFAQQGESLRAAECYVEVDRMSVAGEMFEKAGRFLDAAKCYEACEFQRHAAQMFIKAKEWARAAVCLERVIREEGATNTFHAGADGDLDKLVLHAAKLYEQGGDLASALGVLELGGAHEAAGEVAMRLERFEEAAVFFRQAGKADRAADALRGLGDDASAFRVVAESLRDNGDDEAAAQAFQDAGEYSAAGDLYRKLERFVDAGGAYEQDGEFEQAAEMFRVADDLTRSAQNFERAGRYAEAAQCWEERGSRDKQAELMARVGRYLEAADLFIEINAEDAAIQTLQQVERDSSEYGAAAARLGEIFQRRGELGLATAKLEEAVNGRDIDRGSVDAFYRLAVLHEESGNPTQARTLYERILAFDYAYSDVEQRLKALAAPDVSKGEADISAGARPAEDGERYRIESELGRGGMGIVYRAIDTVLNRTVAFKVLPDALRENPQAVSNFLGEARNAAKLNHPNIVTVFDAGEQGGHFYIAMEYVAGTTLREILRRRGAISPDGVLHLLLQICQALAYAHDAKVVHRDIKTANIMWTREKTAKIMDFGLARVIDAVRNHTTAITGTPYYMSPEQTLGSNIDHRTDIYSLGVTLFELTTGALPFTEGNVPYHHVHTPAPNPRSLKPEIPPVLEGIIVRCMHKNPDERYGHVREIVGEIRDAVRPERA
jgi:tetratricopeptide (TPR) repeat protein